MSFNRPLILASSSPRRQFLMREIGFQFTIAVPDIDESFPEDMEALLVPGYLAAKKAAVFQHDLSEEVVLASDTVVIINQQLLNKPIDREDAIRMISMLSGKTHQVITAFCLLDKTTSKVFQEKTNVTFRKLSKPEIIRYIDTFKPFDKAGAYGAQECLPPAVNPCAAEEIDFLTRIGKSDLIAKSIVDTDSNNRVSIIEKIEGSYFNVMGLPIHKVHEQLTLLSR